MLKIIDLNKSFGKKAVLKDFNFTFEKGVYGLLGPNGAGKTTLIRAITKIYPVKNNTIFYNDIDINFNKNYLNHIGYLSQKFGMFKDLTVNEMMSLMSNLKGISNNSQEAIKNAVELVNLTDKLNVKVGTLSGGMIRRLGIAQAVLNNPDIIIFDEPTAGLDPEERLRFKNIISTIKEDKTIIISTHIVEDVEAVCNKVAIMNEGNVITCGSCYEIEKLAMDKAYELPECNQNQLIGEFHIQKHFERDGEPHIKILSNQKQDLNSVKPNVEDGYICALKRI